MRGSGIPHAVGPRLCTAPKPRNVSQTTIVSRPLSRRQSATSCASMRSNNPYQPPSDEPGSRLTQPRSFQDGNPIVGAANGGSALGTPPRAPPLPIQTSAPTSASVKVPKTSEYQTAALNGLPQQKAGTNLLDKLSRPVAAIWPRGKMTAVILGGGETDSRRLYPLTQFRTLPAIPFGGAYRIIDLLISNVLNSGINKVHVLTAYNSTSLNRHLQRTYDMSGGVPYGGDGYIEVVANAQSPDNQHWATGTAGVVRHFMSFFDSNTKNRWIEDVLILPGDHVYVADLTPMVDYHRATGADLTILCRPVSGEQARQLGVVKLDSDMRIRTFTEKPDAEQLEELAMSDDEMRPFIEANATEQPPSPAWSRLSAARGQARAGSDRVMLDTVASCDEWDMNSGSPGFVGSTGIYIFRRSVLSDALQRHLKSHDFGRQIIPDLIKEGLKVFAYRMPGYWADVGNGVGDFYAANMALLGDKPSINFNQPIESPLFRFPLTIPATQVQGAKVSNAMVSAGCIIQDAVIRNSVVGPRSIIGSRVRVLDSVVMGADHYQHERPQPRPPSPSFPPMGIGEDSVIQQGILDLNARVGKRVALVNKEGVYESHDRAVQGMYIRDGIIVLTKDAVVPDDTVL